MSWFSDLWEGITGTKVLKERIKQLESERIVDLSTIESLKNQLETLRGLVPKTDPLEAYWNTKRPATNNYTYPARTIINGTFNVQVDPRVFFERNDSIIPTVGGKDNDTIAMLALKWVINTVTYTPDYSQFKHEEEWLFAWETLSLARGDCEDGAILLANIMLKSGIPYWRIRLNAGSVEGGGHCWVTYLRESDNQWYILDWCYWPELSVKWLPWKNAEDYFNIWFSWNRDFIFAQDTLDRV